MATRTWIGTTSGDWSVAGNWVEGSVPVSTDDVFLQNNAVSITAGLNQSAVALNSLNIAQTYTGTIGTATSYLQIQSPLVIIGSPAGSQTNANGSGRIMLNLGSATASTIVVINTASQATDSGLEPVRIIGTNAGNTLSVLGGRVGVATNAPGDVATFATINVAGSSSVNPVCNVGSGVTLTTANFSLGSANINCAMTTMNVGPTGQNPITVAGSGAITTANVGGYVNFRSTGTITTLNTSNGGTSDFSGDPRARTVSTCSMYGGATLNTNNGNPLSITFTNGIRLQQCGVSDVTLILGRNFKLTPAA